jgi:hypothetical protein
LGILVIVGGLVYALGQGEALLTYMKDHPGLALVGIGLLMVPYGLVSLVGPIEASPRRSVGRFLSSLPSRVVGLVLIILGLVAIAAGALELLAPQRFDQILEQLGQLLPHMPR